MSATVRTWADGFGRWYAEVPEGDSTPRFTAAREIEHELSLRGDLFPGDRVAVEPAGSPYAPNVYREVDPS